MFVALRKQWFFILRKVGPTRNRCTMPLEVRFKSDGMLRPFWYGRYQVNGERQCDNLGVKIAGNPPEPFSLKSEGDGAFERSRATAQAKLQSIIEEAKTKRDSTRWVEKLYEIKTGEQIQSVKLVELPDKWGKIPRKRALNDRYAAQCRSTLKRFADFVRKHNAQAVDLGHVTRQTARAFMEAEAERGVTAKTCNDTLKLLRATCKYLLPAGSINPFSDVPMLESETVFRKPFSEEELETLLDTARDDGFMYPLIVTAACTGMRRGDVCGLRWSAVDLKGGILAVKTSKTGATIEIPVFDRLREVLVACQGAHPELVFPEANRMLQVNPDGLTRRFKRIVARAFSNDDPPQAEMFQAADVLAEGEAAILERFDAGPRRDRMLSVFRRYCGGESLRDIVNSMGLAKSTVSLDLHTVQDMIGKPFLRVQGTSGKAAIRAATQEKREKGQRAASVRDWHALRATYVTLALSAGVPVELVRRITGHATVEVVLKHYFRPGREQFRSALAGALPLALTGEKTEAEKKALGAEKRGVSAAEELAGLAAKLADGSASKADRARFKKLAAAV